MEMKQQNETRETKEDGKRKGDENRGAERREKGGK
jgi:hypothetical protein